MKIHTKDVVIIGGGMVGLSIANQLIENKITKNILIIDKEASLGLHSSGRNSGVLHSGLYYKPKSIKAKVCVAGAKRLRSWVEERGLPLNPCGKVIVPHRSDLDGELDLLAKRGKSNGTIIELWDEKQLQDFLPGVRTATGRALWSPSTVVVNPKIIVNELKKELEKKGVIFRLCEEHWSLISQDSVLSLHDGSKIKYGHLFNCAGLQADRVAHLFGVGLEYRLIPFKGLYWQMTSNCPIKLRSNLYPVPDLNVPFLGVHFTPNTDPCPLISIGPTATPALGRENYNDFQGIEPLTLSNNMNILLKQYLLNRDGFRKYVHEQAFLSIPMLLIKAAKELIPSLSINHIERSQKVGIRPQLFNQNKGSLEKDFLCLPGLNSTHVLNAISPAFTASFALADLILEKSGLWGKSQ